MRALAFVTLAALALTACSSDTSSNTEQHIPAGGAAGDAGGDSGSGGDGGTSAGEAGSGNAGEGGTAGDEGEAGNAGEGGTSGEGGTGGSAPQVCAPGQQISCACPGSTVKGAQSCNASGTGYGACEGCPSGEGGSGGASGSGGSAGDGGSGGEAGTGACVPTPVECKKENFSPRCGLIDDGCGQQINCGTCEIGDCGGLGGTPMQCRCFVATDNGNHISCNSPQKPDMEGRLVYCASAVDPAPDCQILDFGAGLFCCP